jgi:hypothetical protein
MHGMEDLYNAPADILCSCPRSTRIERSSFRADTPADLYEAFQQARRIDGPVLIEFQINPKIGNLPV